MKLLLIAALIAFGPMTAAAQTTPSAPPAAPPPTAEEIATARAEADRLIAQADAGAFFTNVTSGRVPEVRHDRSGLHCSFEPGERANRIVIYGSDPGARGEDVSCTSLVLDTLKTVYATRYKLPVDSREALTAAVAAIKHRWPDAKWYEGSSVSMSTDRTGKPALPETMLAHYVVKIDGAENYTQARVATLNGWTYKMRMTVPLENVMAGQLLAEMTWMMLLNRLVDGTPI